MLDLLDYRRRVFEIYRAVRSTEDSAAACLHFRQARDVLFRLHPQSALDEIQKKHFTGLYYFPYHPEYRVTARVDTSVEPQVFEYDLGDDGHFRCTRFARVVFTLPTGSGKLNLYWVGGYGGGLFLPFGDATSGTLTYGGGRYLYDTLKGADLGSKENEIVLDFNYACNPSCAYNPRWICPLTPAENRLPFPVMAGEMASGT